MRKTPFLVVNRSFTLYSDHQSCAYHKTNYLQAKKEHINIMLGRVLWKFLDGNMKRKRLNISYK